MYYLLKSLLKKVKDYKDFVFRIENNNKIDNLVFVNLSEKDKIRFMKIMDNYDFDETYFNTEYLNYSIIIHVDKSRLSLRLIVLSNDNIFYIDNYKTDKKIEIEDIKSYLKSKGHILLEMINMEAFKTDNFVKNFTTIAQHIRNTLWGSDINVFLIKHLFDDEYLIEIESATKYPLQEVKIINKNEFRYSLGCKTPNGAAGSDVFYQYRDVEYLLEKLKAFIKNEINIDRTIRAKKHINNECNEIEIVLYSELSKRYFSILIREFSHKHITICFYEDPYNHNLNYRILDIKQGNISNYHELSKNIDDFILDRLIRVFLNKEDRLKFSIDHDNELSQEEFENIKSYINLINY